MKNIIKISFIYIVAAMALMSCTTTQSMAGSEATVQDRGPRISFSVFYQSLSPYGRWISYPQYGQVWIPNAGRRFRPYSTNGQWVYSTYGWTWVSSYAWGWAPFHYGRWLLDNYYGWIWVPGQEWAPAWVAWRNSSDYYGWAPLGPGINININIGIPAARWIFIPRHYFGSRWAHRYYVPRERNITIIHNTTIIRNVNVYENNRYFSGPTRRAVQSATHRTIRPVEIANAQRPGESRINHRQLSIYRPTVRRTVENGHAAPDQTNSPTQSNRPQRVITEESQQNSTEQRQMESSRPERKPDINEREIQKSNNRPASVRGNDRHDSPANDAESGSTGRIISRSAPHTSTSRHATVQRSESINESRPTRVSNKNATRQRPSARSARSVQRDGNGINRETHARHR